MAEDGKDCGVNPTSPDDFEMIRRTLTPDKIGFIAMMSPRRIGASAFMAFLEHRHFTPVPRPRDDFELFQVSWQGLGMCVLIVPGSARPAVDQIAGELGLRIANGVPHVMDSKGDYHFPIDVPNLFTLENIPGHFIYRNNPAEEKTAADYEDEAVDREVAKSMEKLKRWREEHGGLKTL